MYYKSIFFFNLTSDNPLHFKRNLLERTKKLIMISDDKTRDRKLQCNIKIEAAQVSTLLSGKLINMNILQVKKYQLLVKVDS